MLGCLSLLLLPVTVTKPCPSISKTAHLFNTHLLNSYYISDTVPVTKKAQVLLSVRRDVSIV